MTEFIKYVRKIYQLIDHYPDAATTAIILASSFVQIVAGNGLKILLFALFCMLLSLMDLLPTNLIIKNQFKTTRPENYNKTKDSLFRDSFPSFHSVRCRRSNYVHYSYCPILSSKYCFACCNFSRYYCRVLLIDSCLVKGFLTPALSP